MTDEWWTGTWTAKAQINAKAWDSLRWSVCMYARWKINTCNFPFGYFACCSCISLQLQARVELRGFMTSCSGCTIIYTQVDICFQDVCDHVWEWSKFVFSWLQADVKCASRTHHLCSCDRGLWRRKLIHVVMPKYSYVSHCQQHTSWTRFQRAFIWPCSTVFIWFSDVWLPCPPLKTMAYTYESWTRSHEANPAQQSTPHNNAESSGKFAISNCSNSRVLAQQCLTCCYKSLQTATFICRCINLEAAWP